MNTVMGRSHMRRLGMNRWWATLLALGLVLGSIPAIPSSSHATNGDVIKQDPWGGGEGGTYPGDPDGPSGPNKKVPPSGRVSPGGNGYAAAPVGDGAKASSVWSWRYHAVLRSLISWLYRF